MRSFISGLIFLLAACSGPERKAPAAGLTKEALPAPLFTSKKIRIFSDPATRDTFQLTVTGNDYLHAQVAFRILSAAGKVIYHDQFTSDYLIGYGILDKAGPNGSLNDSTRVEYIRERLKHFFDDENFRTPAIGADADFEPQHTSRELFDELRADPRATSFHYLLGKEDGHYLAWSDRFGKVMMFYNCC